MPLSEKQKAYLKTWRKKNAFRLKARRKELRLANLDNVRLRDRLKKVKIRESAPGKLTKQYKQWRYKNPEKQILHQAKIRAKAKGVEFSLSEKDIIIPKVCPVLGINIVLPKDRTEKIFGFCPDSPSLDRIDNTLGYVPGNVWVISMRANKIKGDATLDELIRLVQALQKLEEQYSDTENLGQV